MDESYFNRISTFLKRIVKHAIKCILLLIIVIFYVRVTLNSHAVFLICLECRTEIVVTCYKIYEKVSQNFIRLNILKKSDGEAL